jgi:hypothetical protein
MKELLNMPKYLYKEQQGYRQANLTAIWWLQSQNHLLCHRACAATVAMVSV